MKYKDEFPDFDHEPMVPDGFEDHSWHNDAMPRFYHPILRLTLWVDYVTKSLRDGPDGARVYTLWSDKKELFTADDPALVAEFVSKVTPAATLLDEVAFWRTAINDWAVSNCPCICSGCLTLSDKMDEAAKRFSQEYKEKQ